MIMADTMEQLREIRLGETDEYFYMGFRPPLHPDELDDLPLPVSFVGGKSYSHNPTSVEYHSDGTLDIGFSADTFLVAEDLDFPSYAARVAMHLGDCSLDATVRMIGPGSVIGQAEGVPPQW
jgi:hypothetical protein